MPKAQLPHIPTAEELYDSLMEKIEPDLTMKNLPILKEQYKAETTEEKKIRGKRYQEAFARYDRAYAAYMIDLHSKVTAYRRQAFNGAELEEREKEQQELLKIEDLLQEVS